MEILRRWRRRTAQGNGPTLLSRRHRPTLEIHIPISPTPVFFNMVRCFTHSLRRNGGAYRDAPVILTAGDTAIDPTLPARLPWLAANGIELRWVPVADYERLSYFAQGRQRFAYRHEADVVLLMDADMLIAAPFDELVEAVFEQEVVAGVIAHVTPLLALKPAPVTWERLFAHFGLPRPRLEYEHTGWGYMFRDDALRYCPAYFNYGVVCLPRRFCPRITAIHDETMSRLREIASCHFDGQLTLTLALARLGLPTRALPMRYNFANHTVIEALHAPEIPHARILHLLGHDQITKAQLYESLDSLQTFADATYPRVINARAQEIIRDVLPLIRAEERTVRRVA